MPIRRWESSARLFAGAVLVAAPAAACAQAALLGDKFMPAWHRDGDVITFSNQEPRSRFMAYTVDPGGTRATSLHGLEATVTSATRDGRFVFHSRPAGQPATIGSVRRDGSDARRLTAGPEDGVPIVSPDGARIVYVARSDGRSRVRIMNTDGSHAQSLTPPSAPDEGGRMSWSPDGQWIAFTVGANEQREIYVMHPDGTGRRRITDNAVADFNPAFSPDGRSIAFSSNPAGGGEGNNRIFLMNADGTGRRRLGDISPIHGGVSWSPRGDKLVFNAFGHLPGSTLNIEIYAIDVADAHLEQLTTQPPQPVVTALEADGVAAARRVFDASRTQRSTAKSFSFAAMRRLAVRALQAKEYPKAIAALTFNAEAFGTGDPFMWMDLGEAYAESGDRPNAVRTIRQALTLGLAGPDRDRALRVLEQLGSAAP